MLKSPSLPPDPQKDPDLLSPLSENVPDGKHNYICRDSFHMENIWSG